MKKILFVMIVAAACSAVTALANCGKCETHTGGTSTNAPSTNAPTASQPAK